MSILPLPQVDLASLPGCTSGVELLNPVVPRNLSRPVLQQLVRQALPGVEQHHERWPALGECVHVYRHDGAWAVGALCRDTRNSVRVSGASGQQVWNTVRRLAREWEITGCPVLPASEVSSQTACE